MKRSDRSKGKRIDYDVLNKTGKIVSKVVESPSVADSELNCVAVSSEVISTTINIMEKEIEKLNINQSTIADDVEDFIEENEIDIAVSCIEDIDTNIRKMEVLRTSFRSIHKELRCKVNNEYDDHFGKQYEYTINNIKKYITHGKAVRSMIRKQESQLEKNQLASKQRSKEFMVTELSSAIQHLQHEFGKKSDDLEYDELLRRKSQLSDNLKKMNSITSMFKELLQASNDDNDAEIEEVSITYRRLSKDKDIYLANLQKQIDDEELLKQEKFQSSKLNIKLTKFNGSDASLDIYSFKSKFEKLYKRSTPKSMLPDLLKNNYLDGQALSLVKNLECIDEIWKRLKSLYGDPKMMLNKKLAEINKSGNLWRSKEPDKIIDSLSKIINLMKDLLKLAEDHDIENRLYHGDALERIYNLLGDSRLTRWFTSICDKDLAEKALWTQLILFLESELRIQQQKLLHGCSSERRKTTSDNSSSDKNRRHQNHHTTYDGAEHQTNCFICGKTDHITTNGPKGSKLIQYFVCEKFVEMTPNERFLELRKKGMCFQCLYPGADQQKGRHKDGKCQRDFICKHPSHEKYPSKKHVLVCQEHATTDDNIKILEDYKSRCINKSRSDIPEYSKQIKLSFHSTNLSNSMFPASTSNKRMKNEADIIKDNAIYILQTIEVDKKRFNIFYDTGCSDLVSRFEAVTKLGSRASQEYKGSINIGGVGNLSTISNHGIYQIKLPLHDSKDVILSGVCLDQITVPFPTYPLQGQVEDDIKSAYIKAGGDPRNLPQLPPSVGGETDFMIGAKYLRYHPVPVFQLPSGLTIYQSIFKNADGGRGVIGGPHQLFNKINEFNLSKQNSTFFSNQFQLFKIGVQVNPDVALLDIKCDKDYSKDLMAEATEDEEKQNYSLVTRNEKIFKQVEEAGSEINFRCINCRNCKQCKEHENIEATSIKEEIEQEIINQSVVVDTDNRMTSAKLPLLHKPEVKLAPNKSKAIKVYQQQLRKLSKCPEDKADVIKSEKKLQDLGYVDFVKNLSTQQQKMLAENQNQNFIPWRAVWNGNSISTPCRVVFDASLATESGYSLNDIVAKGKNNMNKLVEIAIRWMTHKIAFHTDIQKMYNAIKLREEHWCLQRYIWQDQLDCKKIPEEKVIKTLIYGVKSSGNQAERGLRETARLSKETYPEVNEIISKDTYVDDCLSGENSQEAALKRADELEIVLNRGGFSLKGITFTNQKPLENLSKDGEKINVAGMKWFPEADELSLDISELNFAKKKRGKKPTSEESKVIPAKLTRRHCVAKVAEIFDITGKITPITASMKLDLHHLVQRKLDWDDVLPDDLRQIWISHFEMMEEIGNIRFNRAVVPSDAVNLEINTIDMGDASQSIACIAIYARFLRKNGNFSCQLIFARSKLIPDGTSQPRAELFAATLNTHTGEVVRKSLYKHHSKSIKLTDSQIVMYWINSYEKPLKPWIRNRVLEIRRFSNPEDWNYVQSKQMVADLGTRRGVKLEDVTQNSIWINGHQWMTKNEDEFPIKSIQQIILTGEEIAIAKNETPAISQNSEILPELQIKTNSTFLCHRTSSISEEVKKRYKFSNFIIDPNRHRFQTVIRILSYVLQFISKMHEQLQKKKHITALKITSISTDYLKQAENYFFKKATEEVKKFVPEKKYKNISKEKNGILYYTGRILPTEKITASGKMTSIMLDLSETTFVVPIVDKESPLAYSIINDIHWYHKVAKHAGIETVYRYVLKYAYIMEGRDLVKLFRKKCERCRYLVKKTISVAMGPVSKVNLQIAPAFYSTQVDLCGPFSAYSNHNKRTTVKIWLVIFCCTTTSATKIKVMDDYSTPSFIQSFTRFSCEVGFPKFLLPDEGSQLVKGCEDMTLNFIDIKNNLHKDVKVEFSICPVGGHHMHGKVERRIKEIKKSIEVSVNKERLSVLQWETLSSEIANTINDLPLALGNVIGDFEQMDLLTPNRLLLGRNNDRSPVAQVNVTDDLVKFMKINKQIFEAWFETWLTSHVPKLMFQPKWFNSDDDLQQGDIVLFLKREGKLSNTYQYGMVSAVEKSSDGRIRRVRVKYRNENENVNRETYRATRQLVMIHSINEMNLMEELGSMNIK